MSGLRLSHSDFRFERFLPPMKNILTSLEGLNSYESRDEALAAIEAFEGHVHLFATHYGETIASHVHITKPIFVGRDDYVVEIYFSDELAALCRMNKTGLGIDTEKMRADFERSIEFWTEACKNASPVSGIWENVRKITAPELTEFRDALLKARAENWIAYAERAASPFARVFTHRDLETLDETTREKIDDARPHAFNRLLDEITKQEDAVFTLINDLADRDPERYRKVASKAILMKMMLAKDHK